MLNLRVYTAGSLALVSSRLAGPMIGVGSWHSNKSTTRARATWSGFGGGSPVAVGLGSTALQHCSIAALAGKGIVGQEIRAGECPRQAKLSAHLPPEDRLSGLREQGSEDVQAPQLDKDDPGRSSACSGRGRAVPVRVVRSTCTRTSTTLVLDPPEAEVDYSHQEFDAYAHRGKKGIGEVAPSLAIKGEKENTQPGDLPVRVLYAPNSLVRATVYPLEIYLTGNLEIGLS
ncbi:hypothetical protein THAR02_01408 [Trichoderma harzianum]|uniref:Uncharacterized protein n=1 Tax=Trichoderma harzianum TaxID=5544 RepID=A0A0F9XPM0_TRIHA|nr:hypothetical protein THAR02_01408 [Trichoderma harzianum]